ncbi:MAG: HigA family addiction module antidote protein [Gammaproteobacteria bacterium]|nr:HigA family addiction module antidote protein [Gammaproteobacteria bacterium]
MMLNPPHLGELIRESMDDVGWNVTETAARLGCERGTLSRLPNGKADVSANMALALEDIGWSTAEHWMRMQASYEFAQARRDQNGARARCTHDPVPPTGGPAAAGDVDLCEPPPRTRIRHRVTKELRTGTPTKNIGA